MMPTAPTVRSATPDDIDDMLRLESALFTEDAGTHDPYADITWPAREGRADFEQLLESDASVLLVSVNDGVTSGFLAGYLSPSSPTRQPVRFAVLRSLFVDAGHRRTGAASALIEAFTSWAREHDCVEAYVDHYAANTGASSLYEAHGFHPRSTTRTLPLT